MIKTSKCGKRGCKLQYRTPNHVNHQHAGIGLVWLESCEHFLSPIHPLFRLTTSSLQNQKFPNVSVTLEQC